jgi:hypothetical protein
MLQGILLKDKVAYILTGSVLREDFADVRGAFLTALRSLTVAPDLFVALQPEKKERMQAILKRLQTLESDEEKQTGLKNVQKILGQEFADVGRYWSFLVQKEALAALFPNPSGQKPPSQ